MKTVVFVHRRLRYEIRVDRKYWEQRSEYNTARETDYSIRHRRERDTEYDTGERHWWPTVHGTEGCTHQDTRYGTEVVFDNV